MIFGKSSCELLPPQLINYSFLWPRSCAAWKLNLIALKISGWCLASLIYKQPCIPFLWKYAVRVMKPLWDTTPTICCNHLLHYQRRGYSIKVDMYQFPDTSKALIVALLPLFCSDDIWGSYSLRVVSTNYVYTNMKMEIDFISCQKIMLLSDTNHGLETQRAKIRKYFIIGPSLTYQLIYAFKNYPRLISVSVLLLTSNKFAGNKDPM